MARSLTQLINEQRDHRIQTLLEAMFSSFGGMDRFQSAWHRYHDQAMKSGGFALYRCLAAVIRLAQYCSEHPPDLSSTSDDELHQCLSEGIMELVVDRPDLVLEAAQRVGWVVEPPS